MAGISEKQRRFADALLETGDVAEAAGIAGYTAEYAGRLRDQPDVAAYMQSRQAEAEQQRVATLVEVLEYLTQVMRSGGQGSMKAVEMLIRWFGPCAERDKELPTPVIVDDLGWDERADEEPGGISERAGLDEDER